MPQLTPTPRVGQSLLRHELQRWPGLQLYSTTRPPGKCPIATVYSPPLKVDSVRQKTRFSAFCGERQEPAFQLRKPVLYPLSYRGTYQLF